MVHLGVRFYEKSSSYKQALYHIDGHTTLLAAQIAGDFTLPSNPSEKLVFIAGGIGITPFRSMLKYLLDTQQKRDIVLFYINRTVDEIAYKDVLSLAQTRLGVRVHFVLTDKASLPTRWSGFAGRLNEQMLATSLTDAHDRLYYLSGPPEMVRSTEECLLKLRISSGQIKKDFFPGLV